ncbi:hypothetical protein ACWCXH_10720 [Kitasatospora sp. NPDC001660]
MLGRGGPLPEDGGRAGADRLLAAGADLISFGHGFLADPDPVERLRTGAPLSPVRDGLMYTGGAEGCTDYPALTGCRPGGRTGLERACRSSASPRVTCAVEHSSGRH